MTPGGEPSIDLPRISSVEPERIELGANLALHGSNLLPNPRVHIASRSLDMFIDEPAEATLAVALPADLELDGCEAAVGVSVETDRRLSEAVYDLGVHDHAVHATIK